MQMREVARGEIFQLDPRAARNPNHGGCLMVATSVHEWGVEGYISIPSPAATFVRAHWTELLETGGTAPRVDAWPD